MASPPPSDQNVALPQPGLRLLGVASIGLGSGLTTANVPFAILALAFVPALIALVMIVIRSTSPATIAEWPSRDDTAQEQIDGRAQHGAPRDAEQAPVRLHGQGGRWAPADQR